jgi:hypothetical protein
MKLVRRKIQLKAVSRLANSFSLIPGIFVTL